jgi:putative glutamine amidotransferase
LLEAIYAAGGEPVTVLPAALAASTAVTALDATAADRLDWCAGLLLPGGGDLAPGHYGQAPLSEHLYDMDEVQDRFDLAAAGWAAENGVPVLAICRGMQVVNAQRGGELEQHMADPHRHRTQRVRVSDPLLCEVLGGDAPTISCYHHQRISTLADDLVCAATAADGTIEAVSDPMARGWFLGVQWHPEDTAEHDSAQAGLLRAFVDAARG